MRLDDILTCLRFYTRLPLPELREAEAPEPFAFSRTAWAVPVAGGVIGSIGALVLLVAAALRLDPLLAAALAVAAPIAVTGALHEDGLADTMDGFGGGRTRERKLAIMRDSRLGTFGAAALLLSIVLRIAALAALVRLDGGLAAAGALVAMHAGARAAGLIPLLVLSPARMDGAGFAAEVPSAQAATTAGLIAGAITLLAVGPGVGVLAGAAALLAAAAASRSVALWAERQIGGQTGDVCGAAEQAAEIAFLTVLAIFAAR